jgi:hypothetical protein
MSEEPVVSAPQAAARAWNKDTIGAGVLTVALWNLAHLVAGGLTFAMGIGAVALALFGFVELFYVIPLAVRASRAGQHARKKGIIIAGCLGVLLTATCWGLVIGSLGNMH